ncbi:BamA/TamA family outer membrane protein [Chryseobacterium aquaticum]|jgi:outer membrane protein assembly factor BamA|uniref:BamA/TamA family outer membrane protein n=1 Tax=Chryseobacterium aquaticum TaxID=452084 RepID=A0A848N273_9FLAO|nr:MULTISPECIES: BamA/TamA family outer membrane protein [Chryseobacterium]NMR32651.1 BamA/TamA family outer membrane protein [Chryseobacterium aquaticum]NRQ45419.1 BamA/TamA family outer membrane protein [Chryseobacterium sp. C-204]
MSCKHFKNSPQKYYKIISFATVIGVLYACSTTKKVPEGEFLLTKNNFQFEDKKEFFDDELKDYVQQKPNKKQLLFVPLGLLLYNAANPKYDTLFSEYLTYPSEMRDQKLRDSLFVKYNMSENVGKSLLWDRILHNWGTPPVILDQTKTDKSAESIKKRMTYRGYWDSEVKFKHDLDSTSKKAAVTYFLKHNSPTNIKDYFYNIPDAGIKSIYQQNINETLVKSNRVLDQTVLEKEVTRINDLMRRSGYYKFNNGNDEVYFVADSLRDRKNVPLTLEIHKDSADSRYKVATIGNIDVAIVEEPSDFGKKTVKDSLRRIRFHKMNEDYKTNSIWRAIIVDNKSVYNQNSLDLTKRNLLAMNNFSILKAKDSLRQGGAIKPNDSIVDVLYLLKPLPKYEVKVGTDVNYSQLLNLGISPSVDLTTRNVFRGAENLSTSLSGTFGSIRNPKNLDKRILAYEISAQASLNFPRLLLPFNYYKLIPKRYTPTSSIVLGTSIQNNIGLGRVNFNTGLNYSANVNDQSSHRLTLFNTLFSLTKNKDNYYDFFVNDNEVRVKVFNDYFNFNPQVKQDFDSGVLTRDEVSEKIISDPDYPTTLDQAKANNLIEFLGTLVNKDRQTQDVIISSMIYNFIYNEIGKKEYPNAFYFNGKVELAGNIPSIFNQKREDAGGILRSPERTIFGIPYAQFVKFDFDVRKYFKFNGNQTFVLRQFIGLGIPYGNSSSMPFVRSYFNGGSNDIRAWVAFGGLGPGGSQIDERVRTYLMGNIKLTTNLEYRIPFNDMYEGAIFTDIGNVWNTENNGFDDQFKFNKFIREMGVGSGFGLRVNVAYITLRVDLAYKIYDPNKPDGEKWRFNKIQPLKPTLNIAFGYPF